MEINEERIGYVCIPRRRLFGRVGVLWCFELIACFAGTGLFLILSSFCIMMLFWLSLKFLPVWRLYYKPLSLYLILALGFVPACFLGRMAREAIWYLIYFV